MDRCAHGLDIRNTCPSCDAEDAAADARDIRRETREGSAAALFAAALDWELGDASASVTESGAIEVKLTSGAVYTLTIKETKAPRR